MTLCWICLTFHAWQKYSLMCPHLCIPINNGVECCEIYRWMFLFCQRCSLWRYEWCSPLRFLGIKISDYYNSGMLLGWCREMSIKPRWTQKSTGLGMAEVPRETPDGSSSSVKDSDQSVCYIPSYSLFTQQIPNKPPSDLFLCLTQFPIQTCKKWSFPPFWSENSASRLHCIFQHISLQILTS